MTLLLSLLGAIEDFSDTIGARFLDLPSASSEKVLAAYARDNLHTPPGPENSGDQGLRPSNPP